MKTKLITIGLAFSIVTASAQDSEFRLLSVEAHNNESGDDIEPNWVLPACIAIGAVAAGYGVYRVLVNWCDKYIPTTNSPPRKVTVQTNSSPGSQAQSASGWQDASSITSTIPCEILVTNFNPSGFFRVRME